MGKKGKPPAQKTPQDKKRLSYAKDRRNNYGNSDKASRRLIPLYKAKQRRLHRSRAQQALSAVGDDPVASDRLESDLSHDMTSQNSFFKKSPGSASGRLGCTA